MQYFRYYEYSSASRFIEIIIESILNSWLLGYSDLYKHMIQPERVCVYVPFPRQYNILEDTYTVNFRWRNFQSKTYMNGTNIAHQNIIMWWGQTGVGFRFVLFFFSRLNMCLGRKRHYNKISQHIQLRFKHELKLIMA